VVTAFIGAIAIAAAFNYGSETQGMISLLFAFLSGAGVEAGGNRVVGVITNKIKTSTTSGSSDISGDITKPT
jgi:hypothetical protein